MHEMSLALDVGRMVEKELERHPGRLVTVGVAVGDDAGVEPSSLEFCLAAVLTHPPFAGARAVLTKVPGDVLRLDYLEIDDGRPDN